MSGTRAWYEGAYRRAVVDMHIPDWDDRFLSQFDAGRYVEMLVKARAQSVVAYAHSHVGLFNYPTRVGQQHRAWKGRDAVQEIIERCHAHGIAVVLYTSLIFDRWAADHHPGWRMITCEGKVHGEGGRHGLLCPNSPYREYVWAFVQEICERFEFEGIRFDMTFWPGLCYCSYCRQRFAGEVGGEIPTTIDWLDERWVAFQRKREQWLVEFAALATGIVRELKPGATVEHQLSTYPLDWVFGVTGALAGQNDFLQGDFYGDALQGSFVRKLLEDLTPHRPFGYETSLAVSLRDHTTLKSEALLEAKASAAIADHAAFILIDGIDPLGTLNPLAYERVGRVFERLMPFYPHLGGQRVQDIALYYSLESKFSFAGNGRPASDPGRTNAHLESCMEAARCLIGSHLPFGVITRGSLARLPDYRVLILSGVNVMDEEEVRAIREWVRAGGALYASGGTSLVDERGRLQPDFMLADVLGVSLVEADWKEREHYIAPAALGQPFFDTCSARYPAYTTSYAMRVQAHPDAQVLATTTLSWPAPDPSRFASIHSNPPWEATDWPEVVLHRFGEGQALYCSSLVEKTPSLRRAFVRLLRLLGDIEGATGSATFRCEADAPEAVEVTLFEQPDRGRYLLSLVNFQHELPNIPVDGIQVRLRLGDRQVKRIVQLPGGQAINHRVQGDTVVLTVLRLETLAMLAVEVA